MTRLTKFAHHSHFREETSILVIPLDLSQLDPSQIRLLANRVRNLPSWRDREAFLRQNQDRRSSPLKEKSKSAINPLIQARRIEQDVSAIEEMLKSDKVLLRNVSEVFEPAMRERYRAFKLGLEVKRKLEEVFGIMKKEKEDFIEAALGGRMVEKLDGTIKCVR
jgi:hypothetical protein